MFSINKIQGVVSVVVVAVVAGLVSPQMAFAKGGHQNGQNGGFRQGKTQAFKTAPQKFIKNHTNPGLGKFNTKIGKKGPILSNATKGKIVKVAAVKKLGSAVKKGNKKPIKPILLKKHHHNHHHRRPLIVPFPLGLYGGGYASYPTTDPTYYPQTDSSVDLVVEDVQMVQPATTVAGPAYRVTFRNQGLQAAGAFRVGIFASVDGQVSDEAESAVEVPGLAGGATSEVTLRMPLSASSEQLTVVVDADEVVAETDKDNNAAEFETEAA